MMEFNPKLLSEIKILLKNIKDSNPSKAFAKFCFKWM